MLLAVVHMIWALSPHLRLTRLWSVYAPGRSRGNLWPGNAVCHDFCRISQCFDLISMTAALYQSSITSLPLLGRGKVRENYALGDDQLLIVTSDRLSAFDVVMSEPIPGKGEVLKRHVQLLV